MGLFSKSKPKADATVHAQEEAPKFERVTWHKEPGLRKLYFYAIVLCVTSATTGYDGMFFNSVQIFQSWKDYFGDPRGAQLGLLVALYQIGSVVSFPVVPLITDNFGRKLSIVIGLIIMIAGAVMQGAGQNYGTFAGGRFLLGFGNSFAQMSSPMLLTEICHPQHRARLTTVYNCLWNLGALIVAWTSFGTENLSGDWPWRIPALLQGAPSLFQCFFIWWIPESPRYLIAKDRHDEALSMLAKYHANGDADHPTVQFEFREIRDTIKMEREANTSTKYLDFFRTKGNRYRLMLLISLAIFSQWSGNAIISNYTSILYDNAGVKNPTTKLGLNAGNTSMSMVVSITFALLVDRVGRRPMFLLATSGMLGTLIVWTLSCGLYEQKRAPGANMAMIFFIWLFSFFYATAWSGLLIGYAVEILPYSLRAKGLMILNMTVQVALCLNNQANPIALEHWKGEEGTGYGGNTWILYLIYAIWVTGELTFIYFMYVETRGPTLEELVKIIDGEDAQVANIDLGQVEKEEIIREESNAQHVAHNPDVKN